MFVVFDGSSPCYCLQMWGASVQPLCLSFGSIALEKVKEDKELVHSRLQAAKCSVMPAETCRQQMFIDEYVDNIMERDCH